MNEQLMTLIKKMKEIGEELDAIDEARKPIQAEYDKLRLFDIPNMMAEDELTSLKGEFGRCTLTADLSVSVKDKVSLHKWLEEGGNGSLIIPTVNAQTLKAFVKEQLRNGEELPEEILKISPFSRAVIYKS